MAERKKTKQLLFTILNVTILVGTTILPTAFADIDNMLTNGFDKGITWKSFVPLKKVTFIQHDKNGLIDDYAYLSSIPSSVFYNKNDDNLYSSPLLFYEEDYHPESIKDRVMDTRQGIDYFMEDWMDYAKGTLDQITLININEQTLEQLDNNQRNFLEKRGKLRYMSYGDDSEYIAIIGEHHYRRSREGSELYYLLPDKRKEQNEEK